MSVKKLLWKESASLIVLANNRALRKPYNYDVLMLKRSERTSLRPNHVVFPGGIKESMDESPRWINYFKKIGIDDKLLRDLTVVNGQRPGIFRKTSPNSIEKEIALRITAIRETFEEVGLFLCRGKNNINNKKEFGEFTEDFDRKHWQHEIHNDPSKFLNMCETLNVVPDLWSLYEWSVWLTPASDKKRFETAFYLVAVDDKPNLICEEQEVNEVLWKNPKEYFQSYQSADVWLQPPQIYELSRLAGISEIEKVQKFASERNSKGLTLFLPVKHKCKNGLVGILPGDDYYPENPNAFTEIREVNENVDQYCSPVKRCHRIITGNNECRAILNFQPFDGHLNPLDMKNIVSKL
ncbi:acyl-coenzyme A diphosphatase NUDT19-like [Episyrphus balteatus]|uniref:acyl-coenzyme A diphosphatase NUDT19-like n=1 Tax=Episyrphus balteatus TaxID=286459 RepID=UPI0024865AFE|nr:acyl-coenzyme A diphosphatase NUDT19-like [Episyrphus balteatus]